MRPTATLGAKAQPALGAGTVSGTAPSVLGRAWRALRHALAQPPSVRLATLRGDARALWGDLTGAPAAPTIRVGKRAPRWGGQGVRTRTMTVREVVRETADAVTLVLAPADGGPFTWQAGEFLTLLVPMEGTAPERRAYSICVPPSAPYPAVTIKQIAGGRVSPRLVSGAAVGQTFEVLGPSGTFVYVPRSIESVGSGGTRELVLIAGGSGITPLRAILETALASESAARVTLVYGNRGVDDVIFGAALAALGMRFGERLRVRHVLENPPEGWPGGVGRLDEDGVRRSLAGLGPEGEVAASTEFWLCGPTPMMQATRRVLVEVGVDPARIHEERFASPERVARAALPTEPVALTVTRGNDARVIAVPPGRTVLEAGLRAGVAMPYSCTMGGCGACRVKLSRGSVAHDAPNCLSSQEAAAGYILACVARPLEPIAVEVPK